MSKDKEVKEETIPMPTEYGGEYTVRKIYETSKVGKSIKVYGDPGPIEKERYYGIGDRLNKIKWSEIHDEVAKNAKKKKKKPS